MFKLFTAISVFFFSLLTVSGNTPDKQPVRVNAVHDDHIQAPPEIDYNLEQLLVDWKSKFFQPEPCPQLERGNVSYPDSVYINRLYAYPSVMELSYNQIVRDYIERYTTRHSSSVQYMLGRGKYYFPMIEDILDKYGLPLELKYLPVIESALNPTAVSRFGATGLWQFMLSTGKMYDLEVNSLVDERRDPVKATEAAARHLKDLYDIFGDWNLVIAAYNSGAGTVQKAIKKSGGLKDYWAIYSFLPRETRGYVPAFIAATYAMNYYSEHNICPMECTYPVSVDTIMINRMLNFQQVADILHISIDEIRNLNPQYKKDIVPGEYKPYPLYLPSKSISEFIVNQDSIFAYKAQTLLAHRKTVEVEGGFGGKITRTHKVRRGESLGTIARKYGVTVTQIKRLNNLRSNNIIAGKLLVINRTATVKKNTAPAGAKALASNTATAVQQQEPEKQEIIQSSDSISDTSGFLANYFKARNVDGGDSPPEEPIPIGENIADTTTTFLVEDAVQETFSASPEHYNENEADRTIYHKVKIGETLLSIAKRYNVPAVEIVAWNKLPSKKAKIGQRLMIKLPEKTEPKEDELLAEAKAPDDALLASAVSIALNADKTETADAPKMDNAVKKPAQPAVYLVKRGDSLSIIAKKYRKITAEDIMLANNLKSDKLSVGQKLKIPVN